MLCVKILPLSTDSSMVVEKVGGTKEAGSGAGGVTAHWDRWCTRGLVCIKETNELKPHLDIMTIDPGGRNTILITVYKNKYKEQQKYHWTVDFPVLLS